MITFNDSAATTLSTIENLIKHVSAHLANQADHETFNVKAFSEKVSGETGLDELLVATVIRSIVRNSEEFENKRGRNGGVQRTIAACQQRDEPQLELFAA